MLSPYRLKKLHSLSPALHYVRTNLEFKAADHRPTTVSSRSLWRWPQDVALTSRAVLPYPHSCSTVCDRRLPRCATRLIYATHLSRRSIKFHCRCFHCHCPISPVLLTPSALPLAAHKHIHYLRNYLHPGLPVHILSCPILHHCAFLHHCTSKSRISKRLWRFQLRAYPWDLPVPGLDPWIPLGDEAWHPQTASRDWRTTLSEALTLPVLDLDSDSDSVWLLIVVVVSFCAEWGGLVMPIGWIRGLLVRIGWWAWIGRLKSPSLWYRMLLEHISWSCRFCGGYIRDGFQTVWFPGRLSDVSDSRRTLLWYSGLELEV